MKTRIRSLFLSSLKLMASRGSYAACLFPIASIAGVSAQAATLGISYNFTGGPTGPPIVSGTNLILDGFFSGSIVSGNPALNAGWNPVTYRDHSVMDTTAGLLNGTFIMTFANSDMLSGNLFEDLSAVPGGMGPFTQSNGQFDAYIRRMRLHLFEWHDQVWFPALLRCAMTSYPAAAYGASSLPKLWAERLSALMTPNQTTDIVDLGSGSGGPIPSIVKELGKAGFAVR